MRKSLTIILSALLAGWINTASAEQVVVQTKSMTMVLNVENGQQPRYVYFGTRLSANDLAHLQSPRNGRMEAYPAYGMNAPAEAALALRHADGNMSTELMATGIDRSSQDGADITRIHLRDRVYPTTVCLSAHPSR